MAEDIWIGDCGGRGQTHLCLKSILRCYIQKCFHVFTFSQKYPRTPYPPILYEYKIANPYHIPKEIYYRRDSVVILYNNSSPIFKATCYRLRRRMLRSHRIYWLLHPASAEVVIVLTPCVCPFVCPSHWTNWHTDVKFAGLAWAYPGWFRMSRP